MEIIKPDPRTIRSLSFASGAAYDFLISLYVLSRPEQYDLSPSWARTVRARLSPANRQQLRFFFGADDSPGTGLLYAVPEMGGPFSAAQLVEYARGMTPGAFAAALLTRGRPSRAAAARAVEELADGRPLPNVLDTPLREFLAGLPAAARRRAERLIAQASALQTAYVGLLEEYRQVHFDSEWAQTAKIVAMRLRQDQALAGRLRAREVIARVTGGVTLAADEGQDVTLVPSYFVAPFVWIVPRSDMVLMLYGVRGAEKAEPPDAVSIDPTLSSGLKALADETRLRVLRLLAHEPMYGQQLAQRLGLSHATVSHHMALLRAAGLTRTELDVGGSKRYSVRHEGLESMFTALRHLLAITSKEDPDEHQQSTTTD